MSGFQKTSMILASCQTTSSRGGGGGRSEEAVRVEVTLLFTGRGIGFGIHRPWALAGGPAGCGVVWVGQSPHPHPNSTASGGKDHCRPACVGVYHTSLKAARELGGPRVRRPCGALWAGATRTLDTIGGNLVEPHIMCWVVLLSHTSDVRGSY